MTAYYNENDKGAAQWLRNLIAAGLIPDGHVDDRSIADVRPSDLDGFVQCHFFAGIAGWPFALDLAGWPRDRPVWTGSCPCQPFSSAGKRQGEADERHLWPEFRRLIAERRPATVFGEQVASKLGREWLSGVRADMEALGYAVGSADLCAAGSGAPHIRQRLFWVADADRSQNNSAKQGQPVSCERRDSVLRNGRAVQGAGEVDSCGLVHAEHGRSGVKEQGAEPGATGDAGGLVHTGEPGLEGHARNGDNGDQPGRINAGVVGSVGPSGWTCFDIIPCRDGKARRVEPGTFPLAHGVSGRVVKLRAYGNAIVPAVAATFIQAFLDCET